MLAAGRAKGGENVRFCDKLVRLRAEKGFSQEGLEICWGFPGRR